jgi:hypothetical protein
MGVWKHIRDSHSRASSGPQGAAEDKDSRIRGSGRQALKLQRPREASSDCRPGHSHIVAHALHRKDAAQDTPRRAGVSVKGNVATGL